jgi:hypothetical protein
LRPPVLVPRGEGQRRNLREVFHVQRQTSDRKRSRNFVDQRQTVLSGLTSREQRSGQLQDSDRALDSF